MTDRHKLWRRLRAPIAVTAALAVALGGAGAAMATGKVEQGIWLSVKDGDILTGKVTLAATDRQDGKPVSLSVEGEEKEVTTAPPKITISFGADGFEAGSGFKNSIWVNGVKVAEPTTSASGYSRVTAAVPATAFKAGANTVRVLTGSTTMNNDPVNNNDDFTVRDLRLVFDDGTSAADPSVSPTTIIQIGDSAGMSRHRDWSVDVPAVQLLAQQTHTWDTTALQAGTYEVVAESEDGSRVARAEVHVDHTAPVTMNLADGDIVAGGREIVAGSDGPVEISVDGTKLPTESRQAADPEFVFQAHDYQTGSFRNSVWLNGELFTEPKVGTVNNYGEVRVTIPWSKMREGLNSFRVRTGSASAPVDEGGANNNDDFSIRNARLEFGSGQVLRDPAVSPDEILRIGDNINPKAYYKEFTINVGPAYRTEYVAHWDSSKVADGERTVVASKEGSKRTASAKVTVDNTGPEVTVRSPEEGKRYKETPFIVDVAATDPHAVDKVEIALDGKVVANGTRFTADELKDGAHALVARAVDKLGNVTEKTVRFETVGNYPLTPSDPDPADGATDLSPSDTTLGVKVADPGGDPVDVAVKWAYTGDFAEGTNTATQGSSTAAVPGRAAGDELDGAGYEALKARDGKVTTSKGTGAYPFQQFEMEVPPNLAAQEYTVSWNGKVPAGQRAALSVWNYGTAKWQLLAEGQGGTDLSLSGKAKVAETVRDGKARVMVQDVAASVISEKDAVFAWMTDTQHYSEREPETYQKMVDWAIDNRHSRNIGYGVHTGDIVEHVGVSQEWANASRIMKTWDDAGLPYGIVPGNHDIGDGHYEVYRTHFGEHRYKGKPWYGGTVDDNVQHYDIISTPGADYLVMYLDWSLGAEEIAWANKVIKAHPEHNVVIATHQYITVGGAYYGPGKQIFDEIVLPNKNVDLVLSGHIHGVALNVKRDGDRTIVEVLADYQEVPTSGGGWMRTVGFDTKAQTISNETFSVLTDGDHYWDRELENFTVQSQLEAPTREVSTDYVGITALTTTTVGTVADVPSGTRVKVPAGALQPDTRYSWYVEATDADGYRATSPVWSFTTGKARTKTTLTGKNESTEFGEGGTLSAGGLPRDATGTVEFKEGDRVLCTGTVTRGKAECDSPPDLPAGTHTVTAHYGGDSVYAGSTANLTLTVAKGDSDLRGDATVSGSSVTLKATLAKLATGGVTFKLNGSVLCTATVQDGAASCSPAAVPGAGRYKVTVEYSGDANFREETDTFTLRTR
ncbi:hypothetical protein Acsp03_16120 [Actinomadura sp. NBRC 104412]|uniref:Ig-like domain repeat protein n=1 Tax=Actinomadura sp. NBRC 104412 TaxID=3032203 RepID=UPI0024A3BACB|nr:Ig-like domain repeat protein [Actinomadura sp. NBRC 104412]GLZ04146.1 hypothetical protein Acsp03_16120 [Actinomadura sp. NBRC 104412]